MIYQIIKKYYFLKNVQISFQVILYIENDIAKPSEMKLIPIAKENALK